MMDANLVKPFTRLLTAFVVSANPTNDQNDVDVIPKSNDNEKGPPSEEDDEVSPPGSLKQTDDMHSNSSLETSLEDLKHEMQNDYRILCSYVSHSSESESEQESITPSTLSTDDLSVDARQCQPPRKGFKTKKKTEKTTDVDLEKRDNNDKKKDKKSKKSKENENMDDFIRNLAKKAVQQSRPKEIVMFDAVIVYVPEDYEAATKFRNDVQAIVQNDLKEDVRIELFDDEKFTQSKVLVVEDVINKSSIVLAYLSNNSNTAEFHFFIEEAIGLTRLQINNPARGSGIYNDNQWILKPVHTQPQKRRCYKTPIGLTTANGIEWYDMASSHTRSKVVAMMKSAIVKRKEVEKSANINRQFGHASKKKPTPHINYKEHVVQSAERRVPLAPQEPKPYQSFTSVDEMSMYGSIPMSDSHTSIPVRQYLQPNNPGLQLEQQHGYGHQYMANERQAFPNNYQASTRPGMPNHQHLNMHGSPTYMVDQHYQRQNPQDYLAANVPTSPYNSPNVNLNPSYQHHPHNPIPGQLYMPPQQNSFQGVGEFRPNQYAGSYQPQYPGSQQRHGLNQQSGMHHLQHHEPILQGNIYNPNANQFNSAGPSGGSDQAINNLPPNNFPLSGQIYPNDYSRSVPINQGPTYQNQPVNQVAYPPTNSGLTPAALGNYMHDQRHDTPDSSQLEVVSRLDGKLIVHPNLSSDDIEVDNSLPFRHQSEPEKHSESKDKQNSSKLVDATDTSENSSDDTDDELPKHSHRKRRPKHKSGKTVNISGCKYVQLGHGNQIQNKSTTRVHEIQEKEEETIKITVDEPKKDQTKSPAQPLRSSNILSESNILSGNNLSQDCISIEDNSIDQDLLRNNLSGHSFSIPSMNKIEDISDALTQVNIPSRPAHVKIDSTENKLESDMHTNNANDPHERFFKNNLKYQQVTLNVIERIDSNENNETLSPVENVPDDQLFGNGHPEEVPTSNASFRFSSTKDLSFVDMMSNFPSRYQSCDNGTDELD